jgi:hypothetical protein
MWFSAHPDIILKMGTKEVLHRTRSMSWGSETGIYRTAEAMRDELPGRLAGGPRVIKRNRGNGGQGVWKVETLASPRNRPIVRVLDATKDAPEEVPLEDFLGRCIEYFQDGSVIDQPFQPRLADGVVRCYMAGDRCAGFGHQKVKALVDLPAARAKAGPRLYTSNGDLRFRRLRRFMEDEWTPQLTTLLEIAPSDLPMIWDADFMLGPLDANGDDSYVTCWARSMSVPFSQFPTRRPPKSLAGLPIGYVGRFERLRRSGKRRVPACVRASAKKTALELGPERLGLAVAAARSKLITSRRSLRGKVAASCRVRAAGLSAPQRSPRPSLNSRPAWMRIHRSRRSPFRSATLGDPKSRANALNAPLAP